MNGRPDRTILVQTYLGTEIPNHIDEDPAPGIVALARASHRLLLAGARQLGSATGRYNCHGLVLANRRTNIPPAGESLDLDRYLLEDELRRVDPPQRVGDVAVYRAGDGSIDHTGIVCRVESLPGGSPVVFVWSMWGGLGEFEHRADLSPYVDCSIEYWRMV